MTCVVSNRPLFVVAQRKVLQSEEESHHALTSSCDAMPNAGPSTLDATQRRGPLHALALCLCSLQAIGACMEWRRPGRVPVACGLWGLQSESTRRYTASIPCKYRWMGLLPSAEHGLAIFSRVAGMCSPLIESCEHSVT